MVEHLLPGGVQRVLAVGHQALLRHVNHLPGSRVHGNGALITQRRLLRLLLRLQEAGSSTNAPSLSCEMSRCCYDDILWGLTMKPKQKHFNTV